MIRQLWPLLMVRDVARSIRFYRDDLGFAVVGEADGGDGVFWCRLERGGACLMLQRSDGSHPIGRRETAAVTLYFVCDDADAMHAELVARGMELEPPSTAYYGMRQLFVPEPDGYAICFESPTEEWSG